MMCEDEDRQNLHVSVFKMAQTKRLLFKSVLLACKCSALVVIHLKPSVLIIKMVKLWPPRLSLIISKIRFKKALTQGPLFDLVNLLLRDSPGQREGNCVVSHSSHHTVYHL